MKHQETLIQRLLSTHKFPGGVHPPQHKAESISAGSVKAEIPARLILPLHQHIGEPAEPIVAVGDKVLKGQRIAKANGYVSAAIHAPTSGIVSDINDYPIPHPSGLNAPCIVIETDGEDKWGERLAVQDWKKLNASALRNIIRDAGIVGLGGAGFPSFIKLNPGASKQIDTLILNGVECEPYITCDDFIMRERSGEIMLGITIMRHALNAKECIIAVEENKPEALQAMTMMAKETSGVKVMSVPTIYPHGSEKQLVQAITGKEVPANGLTTQIGIVCHNVATAATVYRAVYQGESLISRYVTVTGSGVKQAKNIRALMGTPMSELIKQCDGEPASLSRVIMGGPMMGYAMQTDQVPVIKTTNCIIACTVEDVISEPAVMPCIRCGACAEVCPVSLLPQQLYWHAKSRDHDKAQEFNLFDCIECGCCSYVCPSKIPLVQYYRHAKGEIWAGEREKALADIARDRHEFRQTRIEREAAEKAERHRKKKEALAANKKKAAAITATDGKTAAKNSGNKNTAIDDAIAKAKAKRLQQGPAHKKSASENTAGENKTEASDS
ncbi:MAG: electron transport complex subunit RsxC [Thiotrichales bacterium]|nr:electron transport complex subunit RsxC [Thiotrichales bacterium]